MDKILILNGPNMNRLGQRQPEIYGTATLPQIEDRLTQRFDDIELSFFQSNHEGDIIDMLQYASDDPTIDGVVINAGGFSHTSIAIADAIAACSCPVVEVHISNIFAREPMRHTSVLAPYCKGSISGFGIDSYALGIMALRMLADRQPGQ